MEWSTEWVQISEIAFTHYSVIAHLRKIAGIVWDTTTAIDVKRIKTDQTVKQDAKD